MIDDVRRGGAGPAVAWRRDDCTRLTVRLAGETTPIKCDWPSCNGQLHETTLRPAGSRR